MSGKIPEIPVGTLYIAHNLWPKLHMHEYLEEQTISALTFAISKSKMRASIKEQLFLSMSYEHLMNAWIL